MTNGDRLCHKVHLLVLFHYCIRLLIALTVTYLQSSVGELSTPPNTPWAPQYKIGSYFTVPGVKPWVLV